ncbi:MarR family winged helix-turn-helix transcriptional regulator [Yersinia hibernica]|uniref:MarR family transcriptional regulator n=2 Tax=Yersinia TaxID=629 RepID=A0ABX5R6L7_9GAMM|nr:MarR family transcriptional regulator [Yersinia hibernica]AHM76545.1 MarR family transcriptional regulator [Yersinia hibernica]OVZ85179.1 MarR family transcriptional regulator [Yersinia kristensenii]QAX80999.1 MarR family transcriptional regulator [Yersinia hibernica]
MNCTLAVEIFDRQHELLHLFRSITRNRMESVHPDLTFNEMRILIHVGRNSGLTQKELVDRSHTDKAQMARMLASLQDKELLERSPSENDKRVRCLHLSDQGKQLFVRLRDLQEQVANELLKDSPEVLQRQLLELLQQVHRNITHPC